MPAAAAAAPASKGPSSPRCMRLSSVRLASDSPAIAPHHRCQSDPVVGVRRFMMSPPQRRDRALRRGPFEMRRDKKAATSLGQLSMPAKKAFGARLDREGRAAPPATCARGHRGPVAGPGTDARHRRSVNRLLTVMGSNLERAKQTHGLVDKPRPRRAQAPRALGPKRLMLLYARRDARARRCCRLERDAGARLGVQCCSAELLDQPDDAIGATLAIPCTRSAFASAGESPTSIVIATLGRDDSAFTLGAVAAVQTTI